MALVVEELASSSNETRMEQEPQETQQKNLFANTQDLFKGLSQNPFTPQHNSSAKNQPAKKSRKRAPSNSPLQEELREEYRLTCLIKSAV